jgi:hypothetical protein
MAVGEPVGAPIDSAETWADLTTWLPAMLTQLLASEVHVGYRPPQDRRGIICSLRGGSASLRRSKGNHGSLACQRRSANHELSTPVRPTHLCQGVLRAHRHSRTSSCWNGPLNSTLRCGLLPSHPRDPQRGGGPRPALLPLRSDDPRLPRPRRRRARGLAAGPQRRPPVLRDRRCRRLLERERVAGCLWLEPAPHRRAWGSARYTRTTRSTTRCASSRRRPAIRQFSPERRSSRRYRSSAVG